MLPQESLKIGEVANGYVLMQRAISKAPELGIKSLSRPVISWGSSDLDPSKIMPCQWFYDFYVTFNMFKSPCVPRCSQRFPEIFAEGRKLRSSAPSKYQVPDDVRLPISKVIDGHSIIASNPYQGDKTPRTPITQAVGKLPMKASRIPCWNQQPEVRVDISIATRLLLGKKRETCVFLMSKHS